MKAWVHNAGRVSDWRMSSIMRRRSGVICLVMESTPVVGLHKRAIFSDRMFSCDEHFPIVSDSQGSRNGDCTNRCAVGKRHVHEQR
jgi:hypothetical protein